MSDDRFPIRIDADTLQIRSFGDGYELIIECPDGSVYCTYVSPVGDLYEQLIENGEIEP